MQQFENQISLGNKMIKKIKTESKHLLRFSCFMIVIGALAIIFPVVSTLAVNYFIGGTLMFSGIAQIFYCSSVRGTSAYFGALLLALLTMAASLFMIFNPLASVMLLTLILAALFIVEGIFQILLSTKLKPHAKWGWVLFSGIVSLALGVFIASGLAEFSLVFLGILLGINFITTGFAFLLLFAQLKKIT